MNKHILGGPSSEKILKNIMAALEDTMNDIFVNLPEVNGTQDWTPETMKKFDRRKTGHKGSRPEDDWVHLRINGTTFSG